MSDLAALQDAFQRAILEGDDAVLAEILDGPREGRDALFGVYRNAYGARLVEILANEFPTLKAVLGESDFEAAARAYVAAHPSTHRNARHVGRDLPGFLAASAPWSARPALSEIATLEAALTDAFDSADAELIAVADLASVPPDDWGRLRFRPHPSARRLDCSTDAFGIWEAVANDAAPPPETPLDDTQRLLVWRQEATPMVRALGAEEAMLWDEAAAGRTFALLCTMAATYDDPDTAAGRAAGHLVGWLGAGLLAGADLNA